MDHARARLAILTTPLALLLASFLGTSLTGCNTHRLIDAPYVMRSEESRAYYDRIPDSIKTPDIPVLYVTNRAVRDEAASGPRYGYGRGKEMAYGVARVGLSPEPTWDQLVEDSIDGPRSRHYAMSIKSVEPVGIVEPLMRHMTVVDGRIVLADGAVTPIMEDRDAFDRLFDLWFGPGGSGPAYLYIHGFNNTFDDAVYRIAESWHFAGRAGLPICFTWPAGSGGLTGYAYDRESGEFSVVPLKSLIWMLAASPRITEIHIVAHSRGTDVASTALREIQFEIRGLYGRSIYAPMTGREFATQIAPNEEVYRVLKLKSLVLAAPDMDIEVFGQRFLNEGFIHVAERVVIYSSEHDKALGLSNWLFRGHSRLGDLKLDTMDPKMVEVLSKVDKLEIINCNVTSQDTHGYIFRDPAALSDLILLLRDDMDPGVENGRPLERANACVWQLNADYMKPTVAD